MQTSASRLNHCSSSEFLHTQQIRKRKTWNCSSYTHVKTVHTGNSAKPSVPNTTETQGVNFRQIIQESKNEELVQQQEREARSQNFIIHGFSESPETQEGNDEDSNTIGELLGIIEVEAIPESITRLGKRHETNLRPIKVKMTSLNEKQMVMSSLAKLKNATEKFQKISITDDYTFEERQTRGVQAIFKI